MTKERLWFEFFLMTGMREQEVMYTYWADINFTRCDRSRQPQTRSRMDTQGIQGTRDSDSGKLVESLKALRRKRTRHAIWSFRPLAAIRN